MKLRIVTAAFFAACTAAVWGQAEDGCRDVLMYTGRDESIESTDIRVAVKLYEQNCESDTVRSGSSFAAAVDTTVKLIPLKFGVSSGSTAERARAFCKTFDSDYKNNATTYRAISAVNEGSTSAWLDCKKLASRGVVFYPQIGQEKISIGIVKLGPSEQEVRGIDYKDVAVTCSVPESTENPKTRSRATANTHQRLTEKHWVISCSRQLQKAPDGGTDYPSTEIVIDTTAGAFHLPIPASKLLSAKTSTELQNQIAALNSSVRELAARKLDCRVTTAKSAPANREAQIIVEIPPSFRSAYKVTGGGCSVQSGASPVPPVQLSEPFERTGEKTGWKCVLPNNDDYGNKANEVVAHVIYCNVVGR